MNSKEIGKVMPGQTIYRAYCHPGYEDEVDYTTTKVVKVTPCGFRIHDPRPGKTTRWYSFHTKAWASTPELALVRLWFRREKQLHYVTNELDNVVLQLGVLSRKLGRKFALKEVYHALLAKIFPPTIFTNYDETYPGLL